MTLSALRDEMKALLAKATAAPWSAVRMDHGWHIGPQPDGTCSIFDYGCKGAAHSRDNTDGSERDVHEANANLIPLLRNHAPLFAALIEALTPSADTKAAYHGEFKMQVVEEDGDGGERVRDIVVPWTTVKEIMAAIALRAAREGTGT